MSSGGFCEGDANTKSGEYKGGGGGDMSDEGSTERLLEHIDSAMRLAGWHLTI